MRLGTQEAVHDKLRVLESLHNILDALEAVHKKLGTLEAVYNKLRVLEAVHNILEVLEAVHNNGYIRIKADFYDQITSTACFFLAQARSQEVCIKLTEDYEERLLGVSSFIFCAKRLQIMFIIGLEVCSNVTGLLRCACIYFDVLVICLDCL